MDFSIELTPAMAAALPVVFVLIQVIKMLPITNEKVKGWISVLAPIPVGIVGVWLSSQVFGTIRDILYPGIIVGGITGYGFDIIKKTGLVK